jgi:hypothetical protein
VAAICQRLDGIPVAIELAAARARMMSAERIAEALADRFHLLAGGARGAVPRQATLRASVDWSYELLPEPERALLRRLSVFAGGLTLDAAERVGAAGEVGRYVFNVMAVNHDDHTKNFALLRRQGSMLWAKGTTSRGTGKWSARCVTRLIGGTTGLLPQSWAMTLSSEGRPTCNGSGRFDSGW